MDKQLTSWLAQLLKDPFGGNSQTTMILCLAPSAKTRDQQTKILESLKLSSQAQHYFQMNHGIRPIKQHTIKGLQEELAKLKEKYRVLKKRAEELQKFVKKKQVIEAKERAAKRSLQCPQCYTLQVIEPKKDFIQRCEVCEYILFDPAIPWNEEEFEEKRIEKFSETSIVQGHMKLIEELQDRLQQEILEHKQTRAKYDSSAQQRVQIYMNNSEKRLETQITELRRTNEGLMRDKIILNGKIAVLQGKVENYQSEKQIFQSQIRQEDEQLHRLIKVVSESPMKSMKQQMNDSQEELIYGGSQQVYNKSIKRRNKDTSALDYTALHSQASAGDLLNRSDSLTRYMGATITHTQQLPPANTYKNPELLALGDGGEHFTHQPHIMSTHHHTGTHHHGGTRGGGNNPHFERTGAPVGTSHEVDFLYRRVGDLQKAFDEILRMPYMNEAEVKDIINKVYQSHVTRVSNKKLQQINIYRLDTPGRIEEPQPISLPKIKISKPPKSKQPQKPVVKKPHYKYDKGQDEESPDIDDEYDPYLSYSDDSLDDAKPWNGNNHDRVVEHIQHDGMGAGISDSPHQKSSQRSQSSSGVVKNGKYLAMNLMTREEALAEMDAYRLQVTQLQMQIDNANKQYAALIEHNRLSRVDLDTEVRILKEQVEHLALSISQAISERNLYKAEAHAKMVEHELVSQRFLEIRLENDLLKQENERLREALKMLGQDLDLIMHQQQWQEGAPRQQQDGRSLDEAALLEELEVAEQERDAREKRMGKFSPKKVVKQPRRKKSVQDQLR